MTDRATELVDALLADAAEVQADVPDHLMAAVLRDADAVQPAAKPAPSPGLWDAVLDMIGGWSAVGGLATAGVAGIWLGVAPPVALEAVAADFVGTSTAVDLFGNDVLGSFAIDGES